jgi:DNA-binding beta-propeller fold protein YncE
VLRVRWVATAAWLAALCAALGASPALAARGHLFARTIGAACSTSPCGEGQFESPSGIAVAQATGDVYVVDKGDGRVERFSAAGGFVGQFDGSGLLPGEGAGAPTGKLSSPEGIAVDNACELHEPVLTESTTPTCAEFDPSRDAVYVADTGHAVIDKFTADGEYLGQLTEAGGSGFGEVDGVAVDGQGRVWVYTGSGAIDEFGNEAPANSFVTAIQAATQGLGFAEPGFARDSSGAFYDVYRFAKVLAKLNPAGEIVSSEVDGEGVTGVAVEPATNDVFVAKAETVDVFNPAGEPIEHLGAGLLTSASGVGVDTSSENVYVSDAQGDVVDVFVPEPPRAPTIESVSASEVTAKSATLNGELNPRGAATAYRFEYGICASIAACPSTGYDTSVPAGEGELTAGFEVAQLDAHVTGLSGGSVYHVRLVAHNPLGTTVSVEHVLVTSPDAARLSLPDGRDWELVSPTEKQGALIEAIGEGHVTQAAADGSAMSYATAAPSEPDPEGNNNLSQIVSTRTPGGWISRDLAVPHVEATGVALQGQEFRFFSEELTSAAVQPSGAFIPEGTPGALAPAEASEQTAFLRDVWGASGPPAWCAGACYRPLVTSKSPFANVAPATAFGAQCRGSFCGPRFIGATKDMSHAVIESDVALTEAPLSEGGLYEWSHGQLAMVSVLPRGSPAASFPKLGLLNEDTRNAISSDGSRIVWSEHVGEKHLFLRDMTRGESVQLDAVQGGSGENSSEPDFQFASADGSRVFFTDHQRLTADSGGGPNVSHQQDDLYECDIVLEAGKLGCHLTDVTPLHEGESANVQNEILGGADDGSYVYFVANGVQAEGAVHGSCASGLASTAAVLCNLYVTHLQEGAWKTELVTVLSQNDFPDWNGEGSAFFLTKTPVRASPDGRWLEFMSERDLTGYDTRDRSTGKPDEEVYLYSVDSRRVICASCSPSGARPTGVPYGSLHYGLDGQQVWFDARQVAASVPAWSSFGEAQTAYDSRFLLDDGRLLFNSTDALVPADGNEKNDVYEFEPPSVGSCSDESSSFSALSEGCVALISSGQSGTEAGFLDASASGDDVFFFTNAQLAGADTDTGLDVYDAHVCTAAAECFAAPQPPPPPCSSADECRSSSSPQLTLGVPGSASISGSDNFGPSRPTPPKLSNRQKLAKALASCRVRFKRKARRKTCEHSARKRYPVAQAKETKGKHKKSAGKKGARR